MAADILISIVAVIIVLGIMVLVHEWGHFVVAKLFGVRVEIFSFGFGPRLWGKKRGPTDYRISALPLGGYVKMAGDNPNEERKGEPDEFLSKPRWQRTLIVLAGPTMNVLMAVLIMTGLFLVGNTQPVYLDKPVVIAGVIKGSPAEQAGIRPGDRVVEFAGLNDPTWERVFFELALPSTKNIYPVTVERDGQLLNLTVRADSERFAVLGYPAQQVMVESVTRGMPAERSGILPGDEILDMAGMPLASPVEFVSRLQERQGKPTDLTLRRGERVLHVQVHPVRVDIGSGTPRWQVGFLLREATEKRSYALGGALERSVWWNVRLTEQIVRVVAQLFQGRMSLKQLEGPLGIARESGRAARKGPIDLINLMALISLNLGILNLLPIPILDGGHILLLAIEGGLRRDLSVTVKERFVQVGLVFLLLIFAIVMYNDVLKLLPTR